MKADAHEPDGEMLKPHKELDRWYAPLHPGEERARSERSRVVAEPQYGSSDVPPPARDDTADTGSYVGTWNEWVPTGPPEPQPRAEEAAPPQPSVRIPPVRRFEPREFDLRPVRDEQRSRRPLIVVLAGIVVLGLAAFTAAFLLTGGKADKAPAAGVPTSPPAAAAAPTAADDCPEIRDGQVVSGADAGGSGSGPDAIMWFQHSFYVERSGARAWEVVAPGAAVPKPDTLQTGIDSIPAGTRHCLKIVGVADGRYAVDLTELRPDGGRATYKQTVTTNVVDGRTVITGIAAG